MSPEDITKWMSATATPPDTVTLDSALQQWPWFVPMRLMEIAREHQKSPFSAQVLDKLRLYSSDWLPAYTLIVADEEVPNFAQIEPEIPANAAAEARHHDAAMPEGPFVANTEEATPTAEPLIQPLYTEDYFRYEGIDAVDEPVVIEPKADQTPEQPQTLMVMMSFAEWLAHFKTKSQKEQEEAQEKSALRSMWQREKLAAAMEDEPEEIPEDVFEMAVSSITKEDDIVSESLAQIYEKQEKWGAAAEMYRKLALKYPSKSTYFASRAEAAKKRLL
jgi:hypothetical protein